jgi:tetratricopeptide (TPR) repeat protein
MRRVLHIFTTACLLGAFAAPVAYAETGTGTADICASTDNAAYPPERRISACSALIETLTDQPQALAAALVNRGAIYWSIKSNDRALTDLDRAIALDPANPRAFVERSNTYRTMGRLDKAIADGNEAVRLDPSNPKAFDVRGNGFNLNGQNDRAIEDYNEALRLKPDYAQAYSDRGAAYYFKKDYQTALKDYADTLRLDPKNAQAYSNRGAIYRKLGQNDRAIADDSEAIKLDSSVPEYFDNRGLSEADNADYDRAIADYDEAIKLRPQANFLTNRGDAYNSKRDYDRAIADYDRAVALNPGFYLAYYNRGVAYDKKGDYDHAIADYQQALAINPQFDRAAEYLADARQERDRRNAAASDALLPSFNCARADRAVEKAICSDPDLARLDREIDGAYKAALAGRSSKAGLADLRQQQRDFLAARNTSFGNPSYNLKHAMELRLAALRGESASAKP